MICTSLDYLQFIITFNSCSELEVFLDCILETCPDYSESDRVAYLSQSFWSGKSYDRKFVSPRGMNGGYSWINDRVEALCVLPGQFLSQVDQELLVNVLSDFSPCITRVDIALDDYDRRVSFEEVKAIVARGDYALCEYSNIQSSKSSFSEGSPGETIYFGSPSSERRVRFYNAELVHGIAADRWEAQFRRDHAAAVFNDLPRCSMDSWGSFVTGCVDFVYREDRLDRSDRYPFWESIRCEVGVNRLPATKYFPSFERSLSWVDRSCGPMLALIWDCLGMEYFIDRLPDWRSRQSNYHRAIKEGME